MTIENLERDRQARIDEEFLFNREFMFEVYTKLMRPISVYLFNICKDRYVERLV